MKKTTMFSQLLGVLVGLAIGGASLAQTYPVVDTGQTNCYNNTQAIPAPLPGQAFYGQDAQEPGVPAAYRNNGNGTVTDLNTGLMWQRSPDTSGDGVITYSDKLTFAQALTYPDRLNTTRFAGYNDWRLPTVQELYSLIDFRGIEPAPTAQSSAGAVPFINTNYFAFAYGFINSGERVIDSQWATRTVYVANTNQMFGVNFADGRIKGYGTTTPGQAAKTFFVICVRGNPDYGVNSFVNNRNGTITDNATGLMWSQTDSGAGMNWSNALVWVQTKNAARYLGFNDWRMPNAKELQSLVDYTRSPATSRTAAINSLFNCTAILNEGRQLDYPFYWASTTHVGNMDGVYVAFGRALGWLPQPANSLNYVLVDVHGAGAQRSDPKAGNPANYPYGFGPQGDVIRIYNYVRLVRQGLVTVPPVAPPAPPLLTIISPRTNQIFQAARIIVSGTATSTNGIRSVTVNGASSVLNGTTWSCPFNLVAGTNLITAIATDNSAARLTAQQVVRAILTPQQLLPPSTRR